jgi:predicted DNA-binding mobile mystery protein A
MKNQNKQLVIEQLDKKLQKYSVINITDIPPRGWVYSIRTALGMSLKQLAKRLDKSVPTVKEIEEREENKNITLNKLIEVANVLNMQFVYAFIPKEGSLEKIIEKRTQEIAQKIVMRTSHSMELEDQKNRDERLEKAIKDRAEKIKQEMPRYLWD